MLLRVLNHPDYKQKCETPFQMQSGLPRSSCRNSQEHDSAHNNSDDDARAPDSRALVLGSRRRGGRWNRGRGRGRVAQFLLLHEIANEGFARRARGRDRSVERVARVCVRKLGRRDRARGEVVQLGSHGALGNQAEAGHLENGAQLVGTRA
jgi:hypothetical protein